MNNRMLDKRTNKRSDRLQLVEAYAKITFANGRTIEHVIAAGADNVTEALNFAIGDYAKQEADGLYKRGKDGRVKHVEVEYKL